MTSALGSYHHRGNARPCNLPPGGAPESGDADAAHRPSPRAQRRERRAAVSVYCLLFRLGVGWGRGGGAGGGSGCVSGLSPPSSSSRLGRPFCPVKQEIQVCDVHQCSEVVRGLRCHSTILGVGLKCPTESRPPSFAITNEVVSLWYQGQLATLIKRCQIQIIKLTKSINEKKSEFFQQCK